MCSCFRFCSSSFSLSYGFATFAGSINGLAARQLQQAHPDLTSPHVDHIRLWQRPGRVFVLIAPYLLLMNQKFYPSGFFCE